MSRVVALTIALFAWALFLMWIVPDPTPLRVPTSEILLP